MNKNERQAVIDEYLEQTGSDTVVPREFIDWMRPRTNHPAHRYFFARSDEEAAMEYRLSLFRQFASGLRVSFKVKYTDPVSTKVKIEVREFPALISPVAGRKGGGGYERFDPKSAASMSELQRQGAQALQSWLARYRGAAEAAGADVKPIEEIVAHLSRDVAQSA